MALNTPVMLFFIFGAIMLVDFIGAQMIVASGGSELTTGQLSALITYGIQILTAMMMLAFIFVMVTIAAESAHRIAEVLQYESPLTSPEYGIREVPSVGVTLRQPMKKSSEPASFHRLTNLSVSSLMAMTP